MPERFLLYVPDPYGIGGARFTIFEGGEIANLCLEELGAVTGTLISYEVSTLIDELRRSNVVPAFSLIDVSEALRLIAGLSRSDGGERHWDFWRRAKPRFATESAWTIARELHEGRGAPLQEVNIASHFRYLGNAVEEVWRWAQLQLDSLDESKRFFEIEVPVAAIWHHRQRIGIGVASETLEDTLNTASRRKYIAYQEVAGTVGVSPTGLNYWNVSPHLRNTDMKELLALSDGYVLRDQMRLARSVSAFAKSFTEFMDASRDVDILTRLIDSDGRVFPTFHPVGTISSRTLVSDPYLQELRRDFRHVISADAGKILIYFDYAQFEPGVMACLSQDDELIRMYNEGDIYEALSATIFGNAQQRDLCKRIFLAFSYGMTAEGITRLLSDGSKERDDIGSKVAQFFERFPRLKQFRIKAEKQLNDQGYVSTVIGNRRVRAKTGKLASKERRWAVSQMVQGNASLIFKRALIDIAQRYGPDAMLLPVHDAILMQCVEHEHDGLVKEVTDIMTNAFSSLFPGVNVRVTWGPFGQ